MLTSWKAWKLGYFKTLSGVAGWLKIQPAGMTIVSSLFYIQSIYMYKINLPFFAHLLHKTKIGKSFCITNHAHKRSALRDQYLT